jgi:hypothetical protein
MKYRFATVFVASLLASTAVYAQQQGGQAGGQLPPTPQPPSGAAQTQTTPDELSSPMVRQIQARLRQQGYLDARPSGVWDDDTRDAIADLQDANGLQPTGQLDVGTIYILGIVAPPSGSSPQSAMMQGPTMQPQMRQPISSAAASGSGGTTQGISPPGMSPPGMMSGSSSGPSGQGPQQAYQADAQNAYQAGYHNGFEQGFRQAQALLAQLQAQAQGGQAQSGSSRPQGSDRDYRR